MSCVIFSSRKMAVKGKRNFFFCSVQNFINHFFWSIFDWLIKWKFVIFSNGFNYFIIICSFSACGVWINCSLIYGKIFIGNYKIWINLQMKTKPVTFWAHSLGSVEWKHIWCNFWKGDVTFWAGKFWWKDKIFSVYYIYFYKSIC